jgi:hypothetical protein
MADGNSKILLLRVIWSVNVRLHAGIGYLTPAEVHYER